MEVYFLNKTHHDMKKCPQREAIPLRKVAATYLGKKTFSET